MWKHSNKGKYGTLPFKLKKKKMNLTWSSKFGQIKRGVFTWFVHLLQFCCVMSVLRRVLKLYECCTHVGGTVPVTLVSVQ